MELPPINYLAVLAAAFSAFALGGLWYSPVLFAKQWMAYTGHGDCDGEQAANKGNTGLIFGGAFLFSVVAAYLFAMIVMFDDWKSGAIAGAITGFGFAATSFGISYLFEQRPLGLWLINGGYHVLQFTLYGIVLGLMGPYSI